MAYDVTFALDLFSGDSDAPETRAALRALLDALLAIDVAYLRAHPETPRLYAAGIPYVAEPPGEERWQDVPTTIKRGRADCEDLAAWRAAELRVREGVPATTGIRWRRMPDGSYRYHIVVEHPDGQIEDPSLVLGMRP